VFCPDCGTWNRASAPQCVRCKTALPELPPAPTTEPPDEDLGLLRRATGNRYTVLRRLGGGGMAHVYQARHAALGSALAIKVLHRHLARDEEMRIRFRREAEAAARLAHPQICPILDYGSSPDVEFIVMPYFAGGSLGDALGATRTVAPERAASVAVQVASALDYAHRRGVVHRDVKPDNVLFDAEGHAVLTDFGIATARFHARLTQTGRAMGTPHYMSPEQAMGRLVDGRSDLYAVGLLLYEMVLGFPPFDGADSYSVGYKHVHEAPVAPDVVDSRVPAALNAIIMRLLSKSPADRYQRGHDLGDALIAYLAQRDSGVTVADSRIAWRARRSAATPAAI
jgi:serine/threonine protein kinase